MAGLNSCQARLFPAQGPPRVGALPTRESALPPPVPLALCRSPSRAAGQPRSGPPSAPEGQLGTQKPPTRLGVFSEPGEPLLALRGSREAGARERGNSRPASRASVARPAAGEATSERGPLREGRLAPPASPRVLSWSARGAERRVSESRWEIGASGSPAAPADSGKGWGAAGGQALFGSLASRISLTFWARHGDPPVSRSR